MKRSKAPGFLIFLLSFFIFNSTAFAQDKAYARQIIDTLCSPWFAGRGYVEDGYKKAADFLTEEFKAVGLEPVSDAGYQQYFLMSVNTFPGKMEVRVGKRKVLKPGKDYIVHPGSAGCEKTFRLTKTDSFSLANYDINFSPQTGVILNPRERKRISNETIEDRHPGLVVEIMDGRLVWSVAEDTLPWPYLKMRKVKKRKKLSLNIESEYISDYTSSNVIGLVRNPNHPDTFIVIGAHLDHLGKMGSEAVFPGANDNASGIAMMLDMARYFTNPEVRDVLPFSIIFIGFGAEEAGLVGSKYFVENPPVPLSKIGFMINMDLMGNGQDGMMVVNGSEYLKQFDKLKSLNTRKGYLKEIKSRGKAANSDHYWFSENGVPSFFFYLLGNYPWYHDIYDMPEKPNLAGYEGAFKLITEFVREL